MRLGYACLTLGMAEPSMRAAQLGRYDRGLVDLRPIYAYNLEYARRSVEYAAARGMLAHRVSSDIFPLLDHAPDARSLAPSLEPVRREIARRGMHLSSHPSQFVVLSTPHAPVLANSLRVMDDAGWVMDGLGATGSITLHGGGVYGERAAAGARLASNLRHLTRSARRHLALENDERCWTVVELLEATGGEVPIVFDNLHWEANPRSAAYETELAEALRSWPKDRVPELHYSEQARDKPRGTHADLVRGRALLEFLEGVAELSRGRDVAVIVEAKKKDLAIAHAIGELGPARRARLHALVPGLASTPREWIADAARVLGGRAA